MFGPILAKMWRIYYIFHNPTPKKKVYHPHPLYNYPCTILYAFIQNITDWHLGIFIAVVQSVVVVLLVPGFSIPVIIPRAFTSPDGEMRDTRNVSCKLNYCSAASLVISNCFWIKEYSRHS